MVVNLVVETRTFIETLVYDLALLITVLLALYTYTLARRRGGGGEPSSRVSPGLERAVIVLSSLVAFLGVAPVHGAARPPAYFVLQGLLAGLVLYSYATRSIRPYAVAYYMVTALLSIPVTVFYRNLFYPRYMLSSESLYVTGGIEEYMESAVAGGFYYFIPIDPLILVQLSYYIGSSASMLAVPLRAVALYATIYLLVLAASERYGKPLLIVAAMVFVVSPNLSFMDRVLSLPYAFTLLYVSVSPVFYASSQFGFAVVSTILATVMVFAHPVGVFAVLLILFVALVAYRLVGLRASLEAVNAAKNVLLVTATVSATYWFATYIYSLIMPKASRTATAVIRFLHNLFGGEAQEVLLGYTVKRYGAPGYSNPDFYVFAYNWALPIALSLVAVLSLLVVLVSKKGRGPRSPVEVVGASAAVSAVVFIGTAYTGYVLNIEPGQYLIPAGYFSASMGAAYTVLLLGARRAGLLVLVALMGLGVGLGTYTPNWAPLEHSDFEVASLIHPYTSYLEARLFRSHTPGLAVIYSDYDIIVRPGEYKSVRRALYQLLETMDFTPYRSPYYTLFILRADRLQGDEWRLVNASSLVYFSDYHLALGVK